MNKDTIIKMINNYKGKLIHFKYKGARNQIEEFDGVIENTYKSIFTIKLNDQKSVKSFSYSDVITKSLEIFI